MLVLSLRVFGKPLFCDEVGGTIRRKTSNSVLFSYVYNNTHYPLFEIKNLSLNSQVGDTIAIRVNPANPAEITVLTNIALLKVMFVLSGVMILGGVTVPVWYLVKGRKTGE